MKIADWLFHLPRDLMRRAWFVRSLSLRRAYAQVINSRDPDIVARLADGVSLVPLPTEAWLVRALGLPAEVAPQLPVTVAQNLMAVFLYTDLQPGLLLAVAGRSVSIAVPLQWNRYLRDHGLAIAPISSSLKFVALVLRHAARGPKTIARVLFDRSSFPAGDVHVFGLPTASVLPLNTQDPDLNLVAWAARRADFQGAQMVVEVQSGTSLGSFPTVTGPLPPFKTNKARMRFIARCLRLCVVAVLAGLTGRWWPLLILRDLIRLAHAQSIERQQLPAAYLFENSGWIHRPLFTYWAEAIAGSPASLVFYSTNMDELLRLEPDPPLRTVAPGYRLMGWSRFLVWDEHQAQAIVAFGIDRSRIDIVGPVPLNDNGGAGPKVPPLSVAVFEVTPFRPATNALKGVLPAYYQPEIAIAFLEDLQKALATRGATMLLKQKREIGRSAAASYRRFIRELAERPNVMLVEPGLAASRLIAAAALTVSAPYSSPAVLGSNAGKPSVFYDPTGRLVASERQRHGLPLIRGQEELGRWLDEHLT